MSRGRHALPPAPSSDLPLVVGALLIAAGAIAVLWLFDESWASKTVATCAVVLVFLAFVAISRASARQSRQLWDEAVERRHEISEVTRQIAQLHTQHVELLLELRAMREEASETALMHDLLLTRSPEPDAVYPSLQLPLVRAAFAEELSPPDGVPTPRPAALGTRSPASGGVPHVETHGNEAHDSRELLDLTASEIAQLRPAN